MYRTGILQTTLAIRDDYRGHLDVGRCCLGCVFRVRTMVAEDCAESECREGTRGRCDLNHLDTTPRREGRARVTLSPQKRRMISTVAVLNNFTCRYCANTIRVWYRYRSLIDTGVYDRYGCGIVRRWAIPEISYICRPATSNILMRYPKDRRRRCNVAPRSSDGAARCRSRNHGDDAKGNAEVLQVAFDRSLAG